MDIESTLRRVCNKVLADRATDGDVRKARARGLVTMGRIFKAHGSYAAMTKLDVQVHLDSVQQRMREEFEASSNANDS